MLQLKDVSDCSHCPGSRFDNHTLRRGGGVVVVEDVVVSDVLVVKAVLVDSVLVTVVEDVEVDSEL